MNQLKAEINPNVPKEFYENWYFYTEYKDRPHYIDAHTIKYQ